jgi:hypothetical protein
MKGTITITALIGTIAVVAVAVFASTAAGRTSGCVAGVKKINGVSARTFCGPAKASVKLNGKTISLQGRRMLEEHRPLQRQHRDRRPRQPEEQARVPRNHRQR